MVKTFVVWFKNMWSKLFKVDNKVKLKNMLQEKRELKSKLHESYLKAEGERRTLVNKLEAENKVLEDIATAKAIYKEKNDMVSLKQLFDKQQSIKQEIEGYRQALAIITKTVDTLKARDEECTQHLIKLEAKFKQLEFKDEYSKKINDFIKVVGEDGDSNVDLNAIVEDIEVNFNVAEVKLEEHDKEKSLDDLLKHTSVDEEFQKFLDE